MQRDLAGLQANLLEAFGLVAGTRFLKGKQSPPFNHKHQTKRGVRQG